MHYLILFFGVIALLSFLSWRFPEQQKRLARQRRPDAEASGHGRAQRDAEGN